MHAITRGRRRIAFVGACPSVGPGGEAVNDDPVPCPGGEAKNGPPWYRWMTVDPRGFSKSLRRNPRASQAGHLIHNPLGTSSKPLRRGCCVSRRGPGNDHLAATVFRVQAADPRFQIEESFVIIGPAEIGVASHQGCAQAATRFGWSSRQPDNQTNPATHLSVAVPVRVRTPWRADRRLRFCALAAG